MLIRTTLAACLCLLPLAGVAQTKFDPPAADPVVITPPAPVQKNAPDFVFSFGLGGETEPTYFGSDSYEGAVAFGFDFEYLRLGKRELGSLEPKDKTGFAPKFAFRVVAPRKASDSPELAGLNDVDLSLEMGMGLSYSQQNFELFGDARYGAVGHRAFVGELGGDLILRPMDRLTLTAGPRLFLGDQSYAETYFGVTAAEAAASGFTAFAPSGGALSAGVNLGATYQINDTWGLQGTIRYDRLMNDAANSPITQQGSADQFSAKVVLMRRFVLDF